MSDVHQNTEIIEAMRHLATLIREQLDITSFQPLADRVLVIPLKEDDVHKVGSLFVPGGGRNEGSKRAQVVAASPGYTNSRGVTITPDFEVGDVVVVGAYVGEPIEEQDVEFRMVKFGDILAVLPGEGDSA